MGTFVGHVLPGSLLLAVGLWRVWASVARFAADPPAFRVRAWNPVGSVLRHLELYVVAGGAFLDMSLELLYSNPLRVFNGGMLLMFFLFAVLALLSEKTRHLPLPDGVLSLVLATAFMAEFLLFYFHSTTHTDLEEYYDFLLLLLVSLCIVATVLGALLPASFPADLATGVLIALQGLWFFQTALTLHGPMLPAGCARDEIAGAGGDPRAECGNRAAQERAEQLANFQLFGLVFLAFVYVLASYAVAAARYGHPDLTATYDKHLAGMECRGASAADAGEECAI